MSKIIDSIKVLFGLDHVSSIEEKRAWLKIMNEPDFDGRSVDGESVLVSISRDIYYGDALGDFARSVSSYSNDSTDDDAESEKKTLFVSVRSIVKELYQDVNLYNIQGLDEKIALLQNKKAILEGKNLKKHAQARYGVNEIKTFIKRLENRKLVTNKQMERRKNIS